MGKKRSREADGKTADPVDQDVDRMDEDSGEDFDNVDVDFEWFNFDPEIDFHGVKALLRQLFDVDANQFNMSELADLVLAQNTIGSTVKTDGKGTDAYAMLTVLNTHTNKDKAPMADVLKYLVDKAKTNDALAAVPPLLTGDNHVGLVFSERFINMPTEIAPPLFSMLIDEVAAAVEDNEPYNFSHYLILSKTYQEVESTLNVEERKRKKAKEESSIFYFHPEDEMLQKHAVAYGDFQYSNEDSAVADSKRAFQEMGIKAQGHMMLIEASKFPAAIKAVTEYINPPL